MSDDRTDDSLMVACALVLAVIAVVFVIAGLRS